MSVDLWVEVLGLVLLAYTVGLLGGWLLWKLGRAIA